LLQGQKKYEAEFLRWAFQVFSLSTIAYNCLRESCLILPHPTYLRTLSKCFTIESGTESNAHVAYLTQKAKLLQPHERVVVLLLDEIYVSPKISYKAGSVEGFADNCDLSQATTVQAFMICSVLSSKKDMAALVPVKNLTAAYLKELTQKVLSMVEGAGYQVLCIITDNNRVNGNMFALFSYGKLQSCITHPCDPNRKLFFLFDSVHLMKCIRNNWLNQKDSEQTLRFPDIEDLQTIHTAQFKVLKELYESEKQNLIKLAPSLCQKALSPSNTERQSVPLMLRIFNDKIVSVLSVVSQRPNHNSSAINDTRIFIDTILRLWKILNVKHALKGRNQRDVNSDPIRSVNDPHLDFLSKVVLWLDVWEAMADKNRAGLLTRETMSALRHTLTTFNLLCPYMFETLQVKYILLGKFQTDCLEYRFAQYRRLSGTNFHVAVREIIESEKKLKLMSVLSLKSASLGPVSVSQFSADCLNMCDDSVSDLTVLVQQFSAVIDESKSVAISDDDTRVLVFIAGYIGHTVKLSTNCVSCNNELVSQESMPCDIDTDHLIYMNALDRGGLTWPTQMAVDVISRVYMIFQQLVSSDHEKKFSELSNHRAVTVEICMNMLRSQNYFEGVCECGVTLLTLYKKCVVKMCNILLNNYCKRVNDSAVCLKAENAIKTKNSRKLATLSKS
jgi:hypothetical protein